MRFLFSLLLKRCRSGMKYDTFLILKYSFLGVQKLACSQLIV